MRYWEEWTDSNFAGINMKTISLATASVCFLLGGCLTSTAPFYLDDQIVQDERLLGTYPNRNAGHTWLVEKSKSLDEPKKYVATLKNGGGWSTYSLTLFKIGNTLFLDAYPKTDSSVARDPGGPPTMSEIMRELTCQKLHVVLLVVPTDKKLEFRMLSRKGMEYLLKRNEVVPKPDAEGIFITSRSTKDLQKLLVELATDPQMFESIPEQMKPQ